MPTPLRFIRPSETLLRHSFQTLFVLALVAALGSLGCQKQAPEEPVEAPPERVENAALGVAIADLPEVFVVRTNEGGVLELAPADATVEGVLSVEASEPTTSGINLVAAVEDHKAAIQERPDGEFKGQRELNTPMGVAFYSRGHFTGEDGRILEEVAAFMIHPVGDRVLRLVYVYPAGEDSGDRLQNQLFEVLGEIEPATPAEGETGDAASDEAATESSAG